MNGPERPDPLDATILIVDDDPANVLLLERILQREGYRDIASTGDPLEFLSLCAARNPDIVLIDLHMPVLDGIAVMERLAALSDSAPRPPVLVLTADVTPQARERAQDAGASGFLTKPVDPREVAQRVQELLLRG